MDSEGSGSDSELGGAGGGETSGSSIYRARLSDSGIWDQIHRVTKVSETESSGSEVNELDTSQLLKRKEEEEIRKHEERKRRIDQRTMTTRQRSIQAIGGEGRMIESPEPLFPSPEAGANGANASSRSITSNSESKPGNDSKLKELCGAQHPPRLPRTSTPIPLTVGSSLGSRPGSGNRLDEAMLASPSVSTDELLFSSEESEPQDSSESSFISDSDSEEGTSSEDIAEPPEPPQVSPSTSNMNTEQVSQPRTRSPTLQEANMDSSPYDRQPLQTSTPKSRRNLSLATSQISSSSPRRPSITIRPRPVVISPPKTKAQREGAQPSSSSMVRLPKGKTSGRSKTGEVTRYVGHDPFGNYHMMKKSEVKKIFADERPDLALTSEQLLQLTIKINHYLEDFFVHHCEKTAHPHGFIPFKQLLAGMIDQGLLPEDTDSVKFTEEIKKSTSAENFKKAQGILFPSKNSKNQDTDQYMYQ